MDTSQHKLGRYCNRIKSTHTFLFCILSAIHKLQNTIECWWTRHLVNFTRSRVHLLPKILVLPNPNQPTMQLNVIAACTCITISWWALFSMTRNTQCL